VPLAVAASTAGSTDPNSTIVSSSINFGDGTIVNGSSATHTYNTAGTYTVIAIVKDNLGMSATANVTVTAVAKQPPMVVGTLTQTPGVSFKISTAGTYAPSGSSASPVSNLGGRTPVTATSGLHADSTNGTYPVPETVADNIGPKPSVAASAAAKRGVFVVSPQSGFVSTTTSVQFVASAASPNGIRATRILVDGKMAYSGTSDVIDTNLTLTAGTRQVVLQATDNAGIVYQSALTVTVR
jgi:PKD repeat protein